MRLKRPLRHLRAHPALALAASAGVCAGLLIPNVPSAVTRCLLGWNIGVWLYLAFVTFMILRADREHLKRVAMAQAEGAKTVLAVVALATLFSLGAVVIELSAAKGASTREALPHIGLALSTVVGSWLMLPILFGLNYASAYHADNAASGLGFPAAGEPFDPSYSDFFYFSFTIAVASQTSDVTVTTRPMRRLVLLQSVLSFIFNTMILAFSINMAASLF
jgi:uncharacterized membrane protein